MDKKDSCFIYVELEKWSITNKADFKMERWNPMTLLTYDCHCMLMIDHQEGILKKLNKWGKLKDPNRDIRFNWVGQLDSDYIRRCLKAHKK